ncbi:PREDICTED: uncharacterized protein LOC105130652 isoform X4 [Populus euphratica]|uniref:Uncharacterized protein LOC105130652 isoform X4 n=1 Tax=Populus euphratica TaxID=75702 RepID=A0AAJ6UKF7_POPEU|nr:PREDICTED: uncharacterized protein LOC105130652 isoform X4 [Populus euphratica]
MGSCCFLGSTLSLLVLILNLGFTLTNGSSSFSFLSSSSAAAAAMKYVSAIGDPGMKSPNVRVALEAWNFCNEVGFEAPSMGSPRLADCADLYCPVTSVDEPPKPWQFWMVMLKNGNFDKNTTLCPENGKRVSKIITGRNFPCFGKGCMNQPLVYHNYSQLVFSGEKMVSLSGGYFGTYDLDADLSKGVGNNSYFSVFWKKNLSTGSWIFTHKLTTSAKYPWLMLYLRSDATEGFNGGYHYNGSGIMRKLPDSPNFKVKLTLNVTRGGGGNSQFYLLDIGSCWKNNGDPCDGDVLTDVTRYSEMIINPATSSWCRPDNQVSCPPYHVSLTGEKIYRNETSRFPYSAYHLYCSPGNAKYLEKPYDICDPYSNPQAQELVQILPHREWSVHGYPEKQGDGWIGDPRTWELDTGALSSRLYFYQDPGTKPARRVWSSINVGTEIYVSRAGETAEWTVSDFDVLVPEDIANDGHNSY